MPLDISDVVRVSASIRAGGLTREEFGRTLFVGKGSTLSAGGAGKVRSFARLSEVADVFPTTSEEYLAALAYFGQNPRPKNLLIARWAESAVNTVLSGGAPAQVNTIGAVSNGSLTIGGIEVTGLDFSSANTYALQATVLQTALRALTDARFTNSLTVAYSNGAFVIDMDNAADIGGAVTAGSTGTDVATLLGLTTAAGATYAQGSAAETISECLDTVQGINSGFYFVTVEKSESGTADMRAAAAWCEANERFFCGATHGNEGLDATDTTSETALTIAADYTRTMLTWSRAADYKALSIAARLSSVDFAQPASLITPKFKQLPGLSPDTLTTAERAVLDGKRLNYYTRFSGSPIYAEGVMLASGYWADQRYWLDWLIGAIEIDVWNLLRSSPAIPQTSEGIMSLRNTITNVLEQGVANGGIAPGVVSPDFVLDIRQSLPDPRFDGRLSAGYLLWIGLLSAQSQTDRNARVSPPIKIWLKGRGAIHSVAIDLTLEP